MKLIVGLGNPGAEFNNTRHNVGFMAIDFLAGNDFKSEPKFDCFIYKDSEHIYIKPTTFMNLVGKSVSKVVAFYKINPADVYVLHDDADLPFGDIKKHFNRGSAGHNGVIDIIEKLNTQEFWRIRIGIGRPTEAQFDIHDWVLTKFTTQELTTLSQKFSTLKALL